MSTRNAFQRYNQCFCFSSSVAICTSMWSINARLLVDRNPDRATLKKLLLLSPCWNEVFHLGCFPGDSPDGGSAARHHCRVFPRHRSAPGWWCARIHSAPAGGTCQRLSGQVPESPGHLQVLCGAAGEAGEAAARGECFPSLTVFYLPESGGQCWSLMFKHDHTFSDCSQGLISGFLIGGSSDCAGGHRIACLIGFHSVLLPVHWPLMVLSLCIIS